jgi:transposase InsO family protein
MKFEFIYIYRSSFRLTKMCLALQVSRSGYYSWLRRSKSKRQIENEKLLKLIRKVHEGSRCLYGSPRITAELKSRDVKCSKNRVARLMREHNIRSKIKRKYKTTTFSRHTLPVAENIINQNFYPTAPNKVWASDITYIKGRRYWMYLTAIMDLFSRQIIGWALSSDLTSLPLITIVKRTLQQRRPKPGLIFHSDRGVQYASNGFRKILQEHAIIQSMSNKGDCYDNAVMESFFDTLKSEFIAFERFDSVADAHQKLFDYIDIFYNHKRIHSSLNYQSPIAFEMKYYEKSAFQCV